ncbi:uncharacterized protein PAC_13769 [Phialocephala subalpina]|uniref:Uncharacterized protein n=1 Tax=Phialocephala subalpina TaxID=576137 RepID=A0A1L7XFS4_9HELO|nr:uncharacterized protein PAC_13769 [Phialocephala subalpina]
MVNSEPRLTSSLPQYLRATTHPGKEKKKETKRTMKLTRFLRLSLLALVLKFLSISIAQTLTHVIANTTFPEIPTMVTNFPAQVSVLMTRERAVAAENNIIPLRDGRDQGRRYLFGVEGLDDNLAGVELKGSWSRFGRVVVLERGRRMQNWRFLEGMAPDVNNAKITNISTQMNSTFPDALMDSDVNDTKHKGGRGGGTGGKGGGGGAGTATFPLRLEMVVSMLGLAGTLAWLLM